MNPSGSIKDRVVFNILKKVPGKFYEVVEATSGNTGISLSLWAKFFGKKATVVMPKGMGLERKRMMELLGAEVIEIDGDFAEAIKIAKEIAKERGAFYLGQFHREENPKSYRELAEEFKEIGIDYFVAGVGTGGTLMGVAQLLKNEGVKIIGVFPLEEEHEIYGIGDKIVGDFWEESLVDKIYRVSTEEARKYMRKLWNVGFLVGRSSGANLKAALEFSKYGKVGTVFPDSWDRYLIEEGGGLNEDI